jgi:hypothetical protein
MLKFTKKPAEAKALAAKKPTGRSGPDILLDSAVASAEFFWGLCPDHQEKLIGSGLTCETAVAVQIYSEARPDRLATLAGGLRWRSPALVFPHFDQHGRRLDYAILRPSRPRRDQDGNPVKYESPWGQPPRPYFPPLPCCVTAVNTPGMPIVLTEGILKALALVQAGIPCISLQGLWNWVVAGTKPYELMPDLAALDWRERPVLIVADLDPERKPSVYLGAEELARVLTERGATCRIARPPVGARDADGRPFKVGLDDFAVAVGEEALRTWVESFFQSPPTVISLKSYRAMMAEARRGAIRRGGGVVYIDRSPTGAGKSFADGAALLECEKRSLGTVTLVTTHEQARDYVEQMFDCQGIDIASFPQLSEDTCCRHDEALTVLGRGLPFTKVLCNEPCPYRHGCPYFGQMSDAIAAPRAIATQARAITSLPLVSSGRDVFLVHENPQPLFRPTHVASHSLKVVGLIADEAADRLERHTSDADLRFFRYLARMARQLDNELHHANEPAPLPLPRPAVHVPEDLYKQLNEAIDALQIGALKDLQPEGMRLALAAVLGELTDLFVGVEERIDKEGNVTLHRSLHGFDETILRKDATVIISDATAPPGELELLIDRPLIDITPRGRLARLHPALQIVPAKDVTKGRQAGEITPLLRGLLYDLPQYSRVGLLTHQGLAKALPDLLEDEYRSRLRRVSYFGGPDSRGVNTWYEECDCLIVLGTPRVPPHAVRAHLYRLGKIKAGGRHPDWAKDYWSGVTVSGQRRTIQTGHYLDHDWHAAYCAIVQAELLQAIGRGRVILPNGIPVYVVTTENLAPPGEDPDGYNGLRLAEYPTGAPLTEQQARVLKVLTPPSPGRPRMKSTKIAAALGIHRKCAFELLVKLEGAGRVRRSGKCGGWRAVAARTRIERTVTPGL